MNRCTLSSPNGRLSDSVRPLLLGIRCPPVSNCLSRGAVLIGCQLSMVLSMACWLQYRMGRDIMDTQFLGPRIADKLVLSLIVMSLYFAVSLETLTPAHASPLHYTSADI